MARIHRQPPASTAAQAMALDTVMPESQVVVHKFGLDWEGEIKPTPLSRIYRIHIRYRTGKRPEVTVAEPALRSRPGEDLPHTFPGERLCLNYPAEWRPTMLMAHTLLPWTAEWLAYYEIWLATGVWTGGGHQESSPAAVRLPRVVVPTKSDS